MSIYYTGTGDKGETNTLSDKRVSKASGIIEAIGAVDELNSAIGVAL
ncbi:ATP/cobalamin adenosyltransferase, partial [mine drainage metagenome]